MVTAGPGGSDEHADSRQATKPSDMESRQVELLLIVPSRVRLPSSSHADSRVTSQSLARPLIGMSGRSAAVVNAQVRRVNSTWLSGVVRWS